MEVTELNLDDALDLGGTIDLTISTAVGDKTGEEHEPTKSTLNPVQAKFEFTKEQQADLLYAFNLLDHIGDGKIRNDDFRVAIKALGYTPTKEELQHMVNGVDKGKTGKMSFENFSTAIMRKVMAKDSDMDIQKAFRLFDDDDCGHISFDNLKRVNDILGTNLTDEEIEEMLDDADKDVDGFVNFEEFQRMIKNVVHILTP